jgi:anti-sigma B factor antagonist
MHLEIDVTERGDYTVITPHGEVDYATGPQLKEAITDALVAGRLHLVIDMLGVEFIESTGLGALIGGRRRARALDGSLVLVCGESSVLKVLRVTGLDKVFEIHDSVEAATATAVPADGGAWPAPETGDSD